MSHDPKIKIKCEVEYRPHFVVKASQFEGYDDANLEEEIREYADQVVRDNLTTYVENLPRVVAEIREALRVRKLEDEEENK